jgi:pyruvate dehydrogenase E1 component alpha subunit
MEAPYGAEKLKWIYAQLTLIREFEEHANHLFLTGKLPGAIHLYSGQEAVAVGVCLHLRSDDYVFSTHRPHGHCLAKGVDPKSMMAELYGKATGICRGKGGSMHIADLKVGMMGANGIVAGGIPMACGAALRAKVVKTDQVAVSFFGDGACNAGGFHESLNLAAVLKLPVLFVIENNQYAEATHIRYAVAIGNLSERAKAYGMSGITVDGSDVFTVGQAAGEAISNLRREGGPSLLECKTYRYYGHFVGDAGQYRTKSEVEEARKNDCILRFEAKVLKEGWLTEEILQEIRAQSLESVQESVRFAEDSPWPRPEERLDDLFVSY